MKIIYCISFLYLIIACKPSFEEPKISLDTYKIEEGFSMEIVASEPLLKAPVAIDFDGKGRIWAVEMTGFMTNLEGDEEDKPSGTIKILEDLDKDGVMDHSKPFIEGLVLPRALALVYGGLLYAEPPNLWFVEINNDKPGKRTLVDSLYATEGNPEHQPNGLMLNIDNWIYNAGSQYRYQRQGKKWIKEPTSFRGQWGISHDNFGRLYYNTNSVQLSGDHLLPNRLIRNKYHVPKTGVYNALTNDQRVYPLHAVSVNRGYIDGVLNQDSLLVKVTSACGPLVYRGGLFSGDYSENAFVCVPEANLIKRNILSFYGDRIEAKQAWQGKEFLASTDEGFRPVNLSNAPDGNMYIVDMHRGVIQHQAYLSPYLKRKAKLKQLDTIINSGRIIKIKEEKSKPFKTHDLNELSGTALVELLKHKNGWVRDHAQHYLVFKNKTDNIPALKELSCNNNEPLAQIHALYALKGLHALSFDLLKKIALNSNPDVTCHAIVLLEDFVSTKNAPSIKTLFENLMSKGNISIDLYISTTIGTWSTKSQKYFFPLIYKLYDKYNDNSIFVEAILSGLEEVSETLLLDIIEKNNLEKSSLKEQITKSIENKRNNVINSIFSKPPEPDPRTKGLKLFRQVCAACHGMNGVGIKNLAPPLIKSEYIDKPIERLGLIILHGLKGPLHVNGELYNFNHAMPGVLNNNTISDQDVADIISYVTSAFSNKPKKLTTEKIKELRDKKPISGFEFTAEELLEIK